MKKNQKNHFSGLILLLAGFFCLAGVNSAMAQSATPIFEHSFESLDSIAADGGSVNGVTIVPGKTGNGVFIDGTDTLSFPAQNNFNLAKGTLEFWVKPNWDGVTSGSYKYFFSLLRDPAAPHQTELSMYKQVADYHYLTTRFYDQAGVKANSDHIGVLNSWKKDEWHRVRLYWDFSVPVEQRFIWSQIDENFGVYTTSPGYTNWQIPTSLGSFGDISAARFFLGSSYSGIQQFNGTIDEIKIWDQPIFSVPPKDVMFPNLAFNPENPETVEKFKIFFRNDGYCNTFENNNDSPLDCPKLSDSIEPSKNLIFYKTPAFQLLFENNLPRSSEITTEFSSQATPGEKKTVFFNIHSRTALSNVRVNFTDLVGPNGSIQRDNIDMRVVKNWFQGASLSFPYYTPELLLPNDQAYLSQKVLPWQGAGFEAPPSVPRLDHAETKVASNTSKQFAMMISVPASTPAGTYTSTITFAADGASPQTATVKFEVLPFQLRPSEKMHAAFMSWDSLLITSPENAVQYGMKNGGLTEEQKWDLATKNLAFMKDIGFETAFFIFGPCWGTNPDLNSCAKELEAVKKAGMKTPIIYLPTGAQKPVYESLVALMKSYGFEPWFFGFDELGASGVDFGLKDQIEKSKLIHEAGGKVVTYGGKESMDRLANCTPGDASAPHDPVYDSFPAGTCEPIDWAVYFAADYNYLIEVMNGRQEKTANRPEGIGWQSYNEDPWVNRYRCGNLLEVSKLETCMPSYFMSRGGVQKDYYNEFNYWYKTTPGDLGLVWRPYMTIYPSLEGGVPTLQSEAHREAIYDERYLNTWRYYKNLVASKDPGMVAASETLINNMLNNYKDSNYSFYSANFTADKRIPISQYETDRKIIASEIMKLKNAAGGEQYNSDLNFDTKIDLADFDILKTDFLKLAASLVNPKSDINSDGQATIRDIGIMMSQWKP